MRKKKKRVLPKVLVLTIVSLLVVYIVVSYYRSLSDLQTLKLEEAELKVRIVELNEEIDGLNDKLENINSKKSIMENARIRLNMIMPNEVRIITTKKQDE